MRLYTDNNTTDTIQGDEIGRSTIPTSSSDSFHDSQHEPLENKCREDPVAFLTKKYEAVLQQQAKTLMNAQEKDQGKKLIHKVLSKIHGRNKAIDSTIFNKFRGTCADPGLRPPDEFCGSAKAIACFAPWGHRESVFDSVHAAVVDVLRATYEKRSPEVQAAMVDGVDNYCPDNCQDWVQPYDRARYCLYAWMGERYPNMF